MAEMIGYQLDEHVITFEGDDKKSYLHGQTTQDINQLDEHNYLWAGHCDAKGKLWSALKLTQWQNQYLAIASKSQLEASLKELKKYAVFSKVTIEQSPDLICLGVISDNLSDLLDSLEINFNNHTAVDFAFGKALKLADNAIQLIIKESDLDKLPGDITWQQNNVQWRKQIIQLGLPRLSEGAISEFVPQMVNLQAIGGISFTKGCYTGQETVARMKYLGKNKRAMYILSSDEPITETESLNVEMQLNENWRRAGQVIEVASDEHGAIMLAVMPNDITPETKLRTKGSEQSLTLLALPYTLED